MTKLNDADAPAPAEKLPAAPAVGTCHLGRLPCQICGGGLIEIRAKLQCEHCHTIWETCCEGGRG